MVPVSTHLKSWQMLCAHHHRCEGDLLVLGLLVLEGLHYAVAKWTCGHVDTWYFKLPAKCIATTIRMILKLDTVPNSKHSVCYVNLVVINPARPSVHPSISTSVRDMCGTYERWKGGIVHQLTRQHTSAHPKTPKKE